MTSLVLLRCWSSHYLPSQRYSALGALMVSQVTQLAEQLPSYQTTLREKIQSLRGAAASTGTLERASEVLKDLGKELDRPRGGAAVPQLGQRERPI